MIYFPDEKLIRHNGEEYPFDGESVKYMKGVDVPGDKRHIDGDIMHTLVWLLAGDKSLQESFEYLKQSITIRDNFIKSK